MSIESQPQPSPSSPSSARDDRPLLPIAARRHRFVAEVKRKLRNRCGVSNADPLLVAVSGGGDSVALLGACQVLSHRKSHDYNIKSVVAVHVHHHLRDSADQDAEFVKDLCDRLGLQLIIKDVYPAKEPGNIAANARDMRYEALSLAARSVNASFVATAHHGDDQLETILIALCRGAGVDGLSGMAWNRPLEDGLYLVRPLLGLRKANCLAFCQMAELCWREDPTNTDPTQVRARLRRDVLPVLEELWPDAASRATGAADAMGIARHALDAQLQTTFGDANTLSWNRVDIAQLPLPIVAAGLRRAALANHPNIADLLGQSLLNQAAEAICSDDRAPKEYHWPGGVILTVTSKQIQLR